MKHRLRALTIEYLYPTRHARNVADKVVDELSIHLPLSEHVRRWELAYLEAGGIVRGTEHA